MIALTRLFRATSLSILATALGAPLIAGTIAAQVRDARGTLKDAVVYAVPEGRVPAPPRKAAVMDQKDRTFIPHVLVIQTGTPVEFPNSDDIRHHVYSFSPAKPFQLPLYKGTPANPVVFDRAGVATLGCNIHDRMTAFIVIVDTPYFDKTGGNGRAELTNLPAGKYSIRVWYPDMREEPAPVNASIDLGERLDLSFVISPAGLLQKE